MGAVLAGTRFRGDFEQRLKGVLKAVVGNPKRILFIDEIHTIVGAGAASGSTMDASNLLKPSLASGELRCIGSTTYQEYKRSFDRDKALARRFQRIDVLEPSREEARLILAGLKSYYEKHHNVRYTDEALELAVELSSRYINDRYLPDKAIDVMDEAGVGARLAAADGETATVDTREIERVVVANGQDSRTHGFGFRQGQVGNPRRGPQEGRLWPGPCDRGGGALDPDVAQRPGPSRPSGRCLHVRRDQPEWARPKSPANSPR